MTLCTRTHTHTHRQGEEGELYIEKHSKIYLDVLVPLLCTNAMYQLVSPSLMCLLTATESTLSILCFPPDQVNILVGLKLFPFLFVFSEMYNPKEKKKDHINDVKLWPVVYRRLWFSCRCFPACSLSCFKLFPL